MHINKKKGFIFRAAGGNLPCFAEEITSSLQLRSKDHE